MATGGYVEEMQGMIDLTGEAHLSELNLHINGQNSVHDIKKMVDGQKGTTSDLQSIFNYIEILKLAGLVEM